MIIIIIIIIIMIIIIISTAHMTSPFHSPGTSRGSQSEVGSSGEVSPHSCQQRRHRRQARQGTTRTLLGPCAVQCSGVQKIIKSKTTARSPAAVACAPEPPGVVQELAPSYCGLGWLDVRGRQLFSLFYVPPGHQDGKVLFTAAVIDSSFEL